MRRLLIFAFVTTVLALKHRAPVLDLQGSDNFQGIAKTDDSIVTVNPEIRLKTESGPICEYRLSSDQEKEDEIPFEVDVTETGAGQLKVKQGKSLSCKQSPYKYRIAAKRCDEESLSDSAELVVTVDKEANEHAPIFEQLWYSKTVEEGRLYGEILRIRATDEDCDKSGEICHYEIVNNALPFVINERGVLKNTQPLNYTQSHSHIIQVVAEDCRMKRSKPVLVTIKVAESCVLGLQGIPERVKYYPGTGSKLIAEEASVSTCGLECDVDRVEAKVSLRTEHIARGCDRESFSSIEQRKTCNADKNTVELLPKAEGAAPLKSEDNQVVTEEETENDQIYLFDGQNNAIIVPPETTKPVVPKTFTLSFWMKHDRPSKSEGHGPKENIICSSDDHQMSRHHFGLYVHNCKLIMLYRTEKEEGEDNKFRPAEWRWRLAQVCDNQWHHYTISFNFPEADVYVDGRAIPTAEDNPEILDDWPMHSTKLKMKLVIGACWHGRTSTMAQFFNGYLSSVLYLPAKNEHPGVLQCLHQCKEQLQFTGMGYLRPHQEVVLNNEMSEVTLRVNTLSEFEQLIRNVAYVNLRHDPTAGHRGFTISTALKCKDKSELIDLPEAKGYLFVEKAPEPVLTLTGQGVVVRTRNEAHEGTSLLSDLKITVSQTDSDGNSKDTTAKHKLDWCHIRVNPLLNKDREYFSAKATLIASFGLDFEHDKDGLMLKGIEDVKGYEEILEQIHYFNLRPESTPKRTFVVQCSMLNGRVLSNELSVSMSIEEPATTEAPVAVAADAAKATTEFVASKMAKLDPLLLQNHPEMADEKVQNHRLKDELKVDAPQPNLDGALPAILHEPDGSSSGGAVAGGAVAIVVVVCIGFLLVIIVIGILRMRSSTGKRSRKGARRLGDGSDLAWDDSGMNITVNPIIEGNDAEAGHAADEQLSDEDSSESGDSYHEDDEEMMSEDDEDEEGEEVLPHVSGSRQGSTGLEWDDSTLHPTLHSPKTNTYRV